MRPPAAEGCSELTEQELLDAARDHHPGARAELFTRHWDKSVAAAHAMAGPNDAEDLAAEAFARALAQLDQGRGPEIAFRPYIVSTVRRLLADRSRRRPLLLVDDFSGTRFEPIDHDGATERAEATLVRQAFNSLPERWQLALWHSAVDEESLAQVAERLGGNANSMAALNFRAREGLRRAYLAEHVAAPRSPNCVPFLNLLPRTVREGLPDSQEQALQDHLSECVRCRAAADDLYQVNTQLGALLVPAIAGVGWAAYAAAPGAGGVMPAHVVSSDVPSGRGARVLAAGASVALLAGALWLAWPDSEPTPASVARPAVSASAEPTYSGPPVPAPRPKPSAVASPTPRPVAPRTTPPTSTPRPVVPSAQLGRMRSEVLTRAPQAWSHLEVPVFLTESTLQHPVVVRFRAPGVEGLEVHSDTGFARWSCRRTGVFVDCRPGRPTAGAQVLGLDVRHEAPMVVSAQLLVSGAEVGAPTSVDVR